MRFAMDAQRLAGQRLGVGRYIEYLLRNWDAMLEPSERMTLFVREPLRASDLGLSGRFDVRHVGPALTGQLWQNLVLPRHAAGHDVLFGPSYTVPIRYRGRRVVAIHSVNEAESGTHPAWYRYTYERLYRESARRSDAVIVPSLSTKADLQALYGIPEQKIDVVPQGADEAFQPLDDEELLRATRRKWLGDDRPYVLWVGKLSQRRNIPMLLEAFAALKRKARLPHALLLFGPNHLGLPLDRLVSDLGIADSVVQTDGRVASHREVVPVYNAADLYVNASSYEGFSMTLVEALSCGTPVVAVRRGALGEIANGSALMVDEPAVDTLADAMERALTDTALRAELRRKALDRARAFRWRETAGRTLGVLRRVARG